MSRAAASQGRQSEGKIIMATITVTNLNDSGEGSLRAALAEAASNGAGRDDIRFDNYLAGGTIFLASALNLNSDVYIFGESDGYIEGNITISGDTNGNGAADVGDSRFFDVANDRNVGLFDLVFDNGYALGSLDPTGVINVGTGVNLQFVGNVVSNSVVQTANQSVGGPGDAAIIVTTGDNVVIHDSLFTGNTVIGGNGGDGDG